MFQSREVLEQGQNGKPLGTRRDQTWEEGQLWGTCKRLGVPSEKAEDPFGKAHNSPRSL